MSNWPNVFGNYFREARLANGFSLREVERLTGITDTELHKIESGGLECRLSSFVKLCAALGIPPGRLLDDTVTGSWSFYTKRILSDADSLHMLRSLGVTDDLIEPAAAHAGSFCALAAHLLRCASAERKAKTIAYPNEELKLKYLAFAGVVDAMEDRLERLGIVKSLRDHPISELKRQNLLSESYIREAVSEDQRALNFNTKLPDGFSLKKLKMMKRGKSLWLPWIPNTL